MIIASVTDGKIMTDRTFRTSKGAFEENFKHTIPSIIRNGGMPEETGCTRNEEDQEHLTKTKSQRENGKLSVERDNTSDTNLEDYVEDVVPTDSIATGAQKDSNQSKHAETTSGNREATTKMSRHEALMTLNVASGSNLAQIRSKCKMMARKTIQINGVTDTCSQGKKVKMFLKKLQIHVIC